jgi:NAD(P)-dependent dehydrogenase (short-subunit alcohol dehydrogenase family)
MSTAMRKDAEETKKKVEQEGRRCLAIAGDIGEELFCQQVVQQTIREFGKLDILVNNAAEQHPQESSKILAQNNWNGPSVLIFFHSSI